MEEKSKRTIYQGLFVLLVAGMLSGTYLYANGKDIPFLGKVGMSVTVPTCFDGVQNQGETGVDVGGPCTAAAPAPGQEVTKTTLPGVDTAQTVPTQSVEIQCPGTLETKLKLKLWNQLSEDAFDQVDGTYKIFDYYTGKYLSIAGVVNAGAGNTTTEYVPCGANVLVKYTGALIYPVTEHLFASGPSVNNDAGAKIMGTIGVTAWDTTGTESDDNITMGTGQTYTQVKLKVQEIDDAEAAQNLVVLVDYNVSQIRSVSIVGATKLPGVPVCFNDYEGAYDTGVSLDSYGIATFDVVIKAMEGVDPATTIGFKVADKSGYYQNVDKQTFVEPVAGTVIGMCDDNNQNVGITSGEGTDTLTVA